MFGFVIIVGLSYHKTWESPIRLKDTRPTIMISRIKPHKQEFYPREIKAATYNDSKHPNFKGVVEATTSVLQYCNTNPMAGVSLIDLITAIAPRTIVDAKTNGFAAAETCRRESSGLIVNCLIPGFIVLGVAKLLEAFGAGPKGLSKLWANQEALETLRDHYKESGGSAKEYITRLFADAEVLKGKKWIKIVPERLETELSDYANAIENNIKDSKTIKSIRQKLYNKILETTGGAEHIKIHGKVYHDNISTLLRDTLDVGKKFIHDLGKDHTQIDTFVKKATKFVNKKSLLGLAIVIPLAASMQTINRWITKKTSGQEGAPIYKDFGKGKQKTEMTPAQKSTFWTKKIGAAGLMVGTALLSMMKKPSIKMLQFTKNMPSMDQCRWIATATFASRMLASEDENELKEVTWRDIATFSSLYFLGDYVSKGVGTIIQKVKGVPLLNYMQESPKTKNPIKNFWYWVKDTKLKSFDEANAIKATESAIHGSKAKGLRAICEVSSLGFSMLVLGILVPWYVRKETERKEHMKLKSRLQDLMSYPSLNLNGTSNKKTFQAFGMMMQK